MTWDDRSEIEKRQDAEAKELMAKGLIQGLVTERDALEARVRELEGDMAVVHGLSRAHEQKWLAAEREGMAAEARLATAEGLVRDGVASRDMFWQQRAHAFLANQPAAPRGCVHNDFMRGMVCDECQSPAPARTDERWCKIPCEPRGDCPVCGLKPPAPTRTHDRHDCSNPDCGTCMFNQPAAPTRVEAEPPPLTRSIEHRNELERLQQAVLDACRLATLIQSGGATAIAVSSQGGIARAELALRAFKNK